MDRTHSKQRKPSFDVIQLHILHHASDGELYGLWMLEELGEHGYKLNASQLYPRFHRLEEQAFLSRTNRNVDGKIRKYYQLTPEGAAYLAEQKRRLLELISEALSVDELTEALNRRKRRAEAKQAAAVTETES